MKNKILLIVISFTLLLISCGGEDTVNQECFTCENTLTEYCIAQGDDFYTVSINGATASEVPLNGAYWSDVRAQLEEECTNSPLTDCFTCNDTNTQYCYQQGDTFYTVSVANATPSQIELGDLSWQEIKTNLQNDCADDPTEDCFTCESTGAQYCYREGETFYTTTINGETTQTELNGQTWDAIKATLQNDCPTSQTASIVGNWKISDFHGTTSSTVTVNGSSTTTTSEQQATTFDAFVEFTENPNNYNGSGSITIEMTIDGNPAGTYDSQPFESGTYEIAGDQITLDGDPNNTATILTLNDTTLELHFVQETTTTDDTTGAVTVTSLDFYETFTRQ
jgi:hypothetical protein